jgi:hypothetical protein
MLPIALFIDCHTKEMSDHEKMDLENRWLGYWKEKFGMPSCTL